MDMSKYLSVILVMLVMIPLFGLAGWFYFWIFSQEPFPMIVSIVIAVLTAGVLLSFVSVGIGRLREIKKEEKDDLSKY
jgi:uncharacterized integral membrane protein